MTNPDLDVVRDRKRSCRTPLLQARADRSVDERRQLGIGIAATVDTLVEARSPAMVACYLSVGTEPPMEKTLLLLQELGVPMIVPVLQPDADLDWAHYLPGQEVTEGLRGTVQPVVVRPALLSAAQIILAPALAIDDRGHRLGRGGGSYDRALGKRHPAAEIFAVLYDNEIVGELPHEPHDVTVSGAVTASGLRRVP